LTVIGGGALGGKAQGLAGIKRILVEHLRPQEFPGVSIGIPRLTVLATDAFEKFMADNDLYAIALSNAPDDRIAHAFLRAELSPLIVGDLRALIAQMHTPLAVRSSSSLEDALCHPFAGTYATKMIPNNQADVKDRFKKLVEAVKFVWASTFFADAKSYMRAIGRRPEEERMAVIVQEVVGQRLNGRFYPTISGVMRTHDFYARRPSTPADGVVSLAVGLGKTIVDGGLVWTYCPRYPRRGPPFASTQDLLKNTQTRLWAINMTAVPYEPASEAEYLAQCGLDAAEWDDALRLTASTYDARSDRLTMGTGTSGPRVIDFAPILELEDVPLNKIVRRIAAICKETVGTDVEIEFAMTLDRRRGLPARFGFLQLRPMLVAGEVIEVGEGDLRCERALVASDVALGNGSVGAIEDVVYVRPDSFEARHTGAIAAEVEGLNRALADAGRPYVLIGFGRWGSSDPWLGIPVTWPQISGARIIVEATLPDMDVEASQGPHFFHNITSFRVHYLTVHHASSYRIDWNWLNQLPAVAETAFVRHVRTPVPLHGRVDGRTGRGVVLHE
jgi:hypothetical protein